MNRLFYSPGGVLALAVLWLCSSPLEAAPNILIILADDSGYVDFGFQGGGIDGDFANLTPHLDALAATGVRCSNAYVSAPTCCPSRAGLVTGRYQQKFGMENNVSQYPNVGLAPYQVTIADRLRAVGYRTYAVGKWHLGNDLSVYHPNERAFDHFVGFLSGGRTYYAHQGEDDDRLQHNGTYLPEVEGQYITDVWGEKAAELIETHVNAPGDAPFFMYLAFNAVHEPVEPDPDHANDPRIQNIEPTERRALASMTISMDDAVGVVLAKLAEHNLREDTLIFFLNDNGGPEDNENLNAPNWSDNGPLREGKRSLYEGGIRVPFVANWKDTIQPAPGGRVMDDMVSALDLVPTCLAAADEPVYPSEPLDGVNLLPRLKEQTATPLNRCLFWRIAGSAKGWSAARLGPWKYYRKGAEPPELYHLENDLGESTNLAAVYPEKLAQMQALHAEWESGLLEPLWGPAGFAMALPDPGLTVRPSRLGYRLENTAAGFASAGVTLREPLLRSENWTLKWSMQSELGARRNGYITLSDEGADNAIRVGVDFDEGMVAIGELQNQDTSTQSFVGVDPGTELNFFLDYDASTGALTFRFRGQTLTHVLTGSYGDFTRTGFSVRDLAVTSFSPVTLHSQPLAPPRSPSWTRVMTTRDYEAGTTDSAGKFMGGTETLSLVAHGGKLFAGIGFWNDVRFIGDMTDPYPGAQVLVKEAAGAPWKQEIAFGEQYLRTESLQTFSITTDQDGNPLDEPVELLLAGTSPPVIGNIPLYNEVYVWIRDVAGSWTRTSPGSVNAGFPVARLLFDHVDRETGVHNIFCAYGSRTNLVRGGYNPNTGLIEWQETPELQGPRRMLSAGTCNGYLYGCIGSDGDPDNEEGGVFWREDGPVPKWHFIHEFPPNPESAHQDVRGFIGVPHPKGLGYEVGLVSVHALSKISYFDPIGGDPRNGHVVVDELYTEQFLSDEWNDGLPLDYEPTIAAYNDMPEFVDPSTGETVHFLGLWVKDHPAEAGTPEDLNTWYLIRYPNGTYEWGQIIDPAHQSPYPDYKLYPGLRACRCARPSPFPEEAGRVFYSGGFDAATPDSDHHNSAWIYRSELPNESLHLRPRITGISVGIETVHGWNYQLEEHSRQSQFGATGTPLNGSNGVQAQEKRPEPAGKQLFRWRISR